MGQEKKEILNNENITIYKNFKSELINKEKQLWEEIMTQFKNDIAINSKKFVLRHNAPKVEPMLGTFSVEEKLSHASKIAYSFRCCGKNEVWINKMVGKLVQEINICLKRTIETAYFKTVKFKVTKNMVGLVFDIDKSLKFDLFVSLDIVITTLRFVKHYVFNDEKLYDLFFSLFWVKFTQEILPRSLLKCHMPLDPKKAYEFYENFNNLQTLLQPKLEKYKLISNDKIDMSVLKNLTTGFHEEFLKNFRNTILFRIRQLILNSNYKEYKQELLDDINEPLLKKNSISFFQKYPCKISETTFNIVQTLYELVNR
eukprot:UN32011